MARTIAIAGTPRSTGAPPTSPLPSAPASAPARNPVNSSQPLPAGPATPRNRSGNHPAPTLTTTIIPCCRILAEGAGSAVSDRHRRHGSRFRLWATARASNGCNCLRDGKPELVRVGASDPGIVSARIDDHGLEPRLDDPAGGVARQGRSYRRVLGAVGALAAKDARDFGRPAPVNGKVDDRSGCRSTVTMRDPTSSS